MILDKIDKLLNEDGQPDDSIVESTIRKMWRLLQASTMTPNISEAREMLVQVAYLASEPAFLYQLKENTAIKSESVTESNDVLDKIIDIHDYAAGCYFITKKPSPVKSIKTMKDCMNLLKSVYQNVIKQTP